MTAETNSPYADRIQLILGSEVGPISQAGTLGAFNPVRDVEVYVDGSYIPVRTSVFDGVNNRYLLYMDSAIDVQGVVQVLHHMPNPPFYYHDGTTIVSGFALVASYSTAGDASALATASPDPATAGVDVTVSWTSANVAQVRITGTGVDSGFLSAGTGGIGNYVISGGFTATTSLVFNAYDSYGIALITPQNIVVTIS